MQRPASESDQRYKTARWQRVRLRVLNRDLWICRIVAGCPEPATLADHIKPAYDGMPDSLFFGEDNLRAGCRTHNLARIAEPLDRRAAEADSDVVRGDYS